MKKIKSIIFLFALIFTCPLFMFGCGEVKFEDIPYTSSSETSASAVNMVREAKKFMDSLGLEIELETTNTFSFFETADGKVTNKVIKEVITTTIGRTNQNAQATSPNLFTEKVEKYVDNKHVSSEISTYAQAKSSKPYCYYFYQDLKTNGKYEKLRKESETFARSDFFDIIQLARAEEIDSVLQKTYKDNVHYRLVSGVNGQSVVNDRFVEDADGNFLESPKLFEVMSKAKLDAVVDYSYDFSIKNKYLDYVRINYNVETKTHGEKYLSVVSETKLVQYGESVLLNLPNDAGEYIANSFKKAMEEEKNIITYSLENKNVTVTKVGNEYLVKEEDTTTTPHEIKKYLIKFENNKHTAYLVTEPITSSDKGQLTENVYELELLNYDFSLSLYRTEKNNYHYGTEASYITIKVDSLDVKALSYYKTGKEGNVLLDIQIGEISIDDVSQFNAIKGYEVSTSGSSEPTEPTT